MKTEFTVSNHEYRIKKMNMIEVLALQSQITFKDIASTEALYNAMFERCEVNICEKWLIDNYNGINNEFTGDI